MPNLDGDEPLLNREFINKNSGKVLLIYFWSISCNQCEQSFTKLKELQRMFGNRLAIFTIHMPRSVKDKDITTIKKVIKKVQIEFPIYVDQQLRLTDAFENRIVPAYYVFDEQQKLRFYKAGVATAKLLQQKIERII